jgi:hypothetical protein
MDFDGFKIHSTIVITVLSNDDGAKVLVARIALPTHFPRLSLLM